MNPPASGTLPAPSLVSPASDARFNAGQTIVFDWSDVAGAANYIIQIDDQELVLLAERQSDGLGFDVFHEHAFGRLVSGGECAPSTRRVTQEHGRRLVASK